MPYNETINLPKTDFPMRAGLSEREPGFLKNWYDNDFYNKLMEINKNKPLFILHDGPPYANGDIHMGHALDKILKDFIVRYKNMSGFKSPFVPGWDTHGLPIERQAIKAYAINRESVSTVDFRKKCEEFALKHIDTQKQQFKRLGCIGEWDNPYLTLMPSFEAAQIRVFGEMANCGYIYKGLKPVYWCPKDETALAEAEIEYTDDTCRSIYVKFKVCDGKGKLDNNTYFVIWTTTTWTLPGNVAIAINPDFEYAIVRLKTGEKLVAAKELVENLTKAANLGEFKIVETFLGKELENITVSHPFIDRESLVILGDHVTLEAGTGCVHTAPGHGIEDFAACKPYGLEVVVPVDGKGFLNNLAGQFAGLHYEKSNEVILEFLKETNALLAEETVTHSYPHCWRCKSPIIFRATEQWFCSIDSIKDKAVEACRNVKWFPKWGEERIVSMVTERNDWCISRQRVWGVPIPIFYCKECNKPIINEETIEVVSNLFEKEGSNSWYLKSADEILPGGFSCECGCTEFTKESDIMDVWFDSGSSHSGVLGARDYLSCPADVYLEGNDQYRGWFQSSLLTSVATKGCAPYKIVITHGMTVDEEMKKMSKSAGNGIVPDKILNLYGADILRLWVASQDYRQDMKMSLDMFKQISQIYLKIRNTARFILGNICDFNPKTDMVKDSDLLEIDRFALLKFGKLLEKVTLAYEEFEYHTAFHAVHNFCVVDMSNFYLDVIKDRLYVESGIKRRSAQTAIWKILDGMVRIIAPLLAFTADEIWSYLPHLENDNAENILFNEIKKADTEFDIDLEKKWEKILELRDTVLKSLEAARAEKIIGKPLEAKVNLLCDDENYSFAKSVSDVLPQVFIVSEVVVEKSAEQGVTAAVSRATGESCERCWIYSENVGKNSEHPTLCERCVSEVSYKG